MSVPYNKIEYINLEKLFLDPRNPRLGRAISESTANQERLMEHMRSWSLEELAVSFIQNGFWPQEAVIVVDEEIYNVPHRFVVVEGNRRIAALRYLKRAVEGDPVSPLWQKLVGEVQIDHSLFTDVPFILAPSREAVNSFLGFRHVTGIKQWAPSEKAEFIARMVDENNMTYEDIRKQIGSRTDVVRRNYIAYRILQQINELEIEISDEGLENRFSVLFLSLRESGVQKFLNVDVKSEPEGAQTPVSEDNVENLGDFAKWLFGSNESKPLFTDSRSVGDFARVLASENAIEYLRSVPEPSFDLAMQKAGIEDEEIENQLKEASNQMELALSRVHLHRESESIQKAIRRLALNAKEIVLKFPRIAIEIGLQRNSENDA